MKTEDIIDTSSTQAIYTIDISNVFGKEYINMFNDVARFVIIQIAIQFMLYALNPDKFSFFSADFMMLLLFIVIGVMLYWLVFKKIISFQ